MADTAPVMARVQQAEAEPRGLGDVDRQAPAGRLRLRDGWTRGATVVGLLPVGVLVSLPLLLLVSAGVSPLPVVTESLAYRYFNSLRVLEGERGLVFIVQGQAPGLVNHGLVWLLGAAGIPLTDLRTRLDLFTYVFLGLNAVGTVIVVALAVVDRRFRWTDCLTVAIVPIWATYSSQGALSLSLRPDYYVVEGLLTTAAVYLFLRQWRADRPQSLVQWTVGLGVLAGIMAATKIGLFWTGLLAAAPVLLFGAGPLRLALRCTLFVFVAIAVFFFVTLAFYRFDASIMPEFLARWLAFVSNPGSEDRFWISLLFPGSPGANPSADYGYGRLVLALWGLAILISVASAASRWRTDPRGLAVPVMVLALGGWQMLGLVVRPAGTTLYEIGLFAVASGGVLLATLPGLRARTWSIAGWTAVLAVHCVVSGLVNGPIIWPLSAFRESSATVWQAHAWLQQRAQPVVVFIPDNRHTAGTVEEALLKGMSDLPTWNIGQGKALLSEMAPRLSFQQSLAEVPSGVTVFWIEVVGEAQLVDAYPALGAFMRGAQQTDPARCRTWQIATYPWYQRVLHACLSGSVGQ